MEKVKITNLQASLLIVSTIFPTAVLTVPKEVGKYSLQLSWLSILIAMMLIFPVVYLTTALCKAYQGKTLFQIIEKLLGNKLSKGIGILLAFYYFSTCFYVLYQFSDFMTASVMPDTPSVAFHIMLAIYILYAVHLGIEVIARANTIVLLFSMIVFVLSVLFLLVKVEWTHLLPLTEISFSHILLGTYAPLGWLSEFTIILLFAPYLQHKEKVRKTAFLGVVLTGALLFITMLGTLLIYNPKYITFLRYPTFSLIRKIQIIEGFQRIDVLFVAVWIGAMVMKAALFMFGAVYCLCEPFRMNPRGPILLPFFFLVIMYATSSWRDSQHLDTYSTYTFPAFVFLFNILFPLILFFISLIRRGRKASED